MVDMHAKSDIVSHSPTRLLWALPSDFESACRAIWHNGWIPFGRRIDIRQSATFNGNSTETSHLFGISPYDPFPWILALMMLTRLETLVCNRTLMMRACHVLLFKTSHKHLECYLGQGLQMTSVGFPLTTRTGTSLEVRQLIIHRQSRVKIVRGLHKHKRIFGWPNKEDLQHLANTYTWFSIMNFRPASPGIENQYTRLDNFCITDYWGNFYTISL